jgi:hypothetical protein
MVRAVGNRVATEDSHDLEHLIAIQGELDDAWTTAVAGLRRGGVSDAMIGEVLGMTRQAVFQKFPRAAVQTVTRAGS